MREPVYRFPSLSITYFSPFLFQVITSLEEKYVHQLVKRFTSDLKNILVYDRVRESVEKFCANNTIDEVSILNS